jgi:hypothetical protein
MTRVNSVKMIGKVRSQNIVTPRFRVANGFLFRVKRDTCIIISADRLFSHATFVKHHRRRPASGLGQKPRAWRVGSLGVRFGRGTAKMEKKVGVLGRVYFSGRRFSADRTVRHQLVFPSEFQSTPVNDSGNY